MTEVITNSRVMRFLGMCHAFVQTCIFISWPLFTGLYWYCYNPSAFVASIQDGTYQCLQSMVDWFREALGIPMEKKYNSVLFGGRRKWCDIWCSQCRCLLFTDLKRYLFACNFLGLIGSLFSVLQFLASPVTGALSDHYGRRPLLLLTTVSKNGIIDSQTYSYFCIGPMLVWSHLIWFLVIQVGLMLSYAVWAVSQSFSMFLLFRVIGGICKGNVSLCTAIMADLPCPKARNRGMVSWDGALFIVYSAVVPYT